MNKFAKAIRNEENMTRTENGMKAYKSTTNACLDLFAVIGALRSRPDGEGKVDFQLNRAHTLLAEAYKENPLYATRTVFYARDVREGLGERDLPRYLFRYLAKNHPEAIKGNLDLIGVYGRYDDLYSFIGTPLEDEMWKAMKKQFEEDKRNLAEGNAISLLAKWIKTPDASSERTKKLGILTAKKLGYSVYDFKRLLRKMRKEIDIVETYMSAGEWDKIKYSAVPSRAMTVYRKAFSKHDCTRFGEFINKAVRGEEKINSSTLYPYDIIEKMLYTGERSDVLEAQWKQLPNYVEEGQNIVVMADTSGSMYGRPMASAVGLATYFAERNKGDFHNLFMTFSSNPTWIKLKGETLEQKVDCVQRAEWGFSTNIEKAFDLVLDTAKKGNVPQEDMPKAIVIISDMEFDTCVEDCNGTFMDSVRKKYTKAGYEVPQIIFWNVDSRNDTFHTKGGSNALLVSGQAASTFKTLIGCLGMTAYQMMAEVLESERYAPITIEDGKASQSA